MRAGSGPAAAWTFDETTGSAGDVTSHANTATLSGGATRTPGRAGVGSALSLNGTTGYVATSGPVLTPHPDTGVMTPVRTDTSFTVTARVRLTATGGGDVAAVSADGTRTSAYVLGYSGSSSRWMFRMAGSDVDAPATVTVASNAAPTVGTWTHLAATYDASTQQLRLYVNGTVQTATATLSGGFNATGSVAVGRRRFAGANTGFLGGATDDVRVYNFVETAVELAELAVPLAPAVSFPNGTQVIAGASLSVVFDAGGDTNVTTFKYSAFDDDLDLTATPGTPGGAATVAIAVGSAPGEYPLYVAGVHGGLVGVATAADFVVTPAASVSGVVIDWEFFAPVQGAVVTLNPGGLSTTTDAGGGFAFAGFAPGTYTIAATFGGRCGLSAQVEVDILGPGEFVDLMLFAFVDELGYTCAEQAIGFNPADGAVLALSGDDAVTAVDLPFAFPFYGHAYYEAFVDTNGFVSFTDPGGSHPYGGGPAIPATAEPNAMVAPFWDDLVVDEQASVRTETTGSGAGARFVIEWRNVHRRDSSAQRLSFEVTLAPDGTVSVNYADLDNPAERGAQAVVGIEAPSGEDGLAYSVGETVLLSGQAVVFDNPDEVNPIDTFDLSGILVDAGGAAVVGASVTLDPRGRSAITGPGGAWAFDDLVADSYAVSVTVGGRCAAQVRAQVELTGDTVRNLALGPDYGAMGYACTVGPSGYVAASDVSTLSGDDQAEQVTLPFPVMLHGRSYSTAWLTTNGNVVFGDDPALGWTDNVAMPNAEAPNAVVAPLWDHDLVVDGQASVATQLLGTAPDRAFVVEWRNVTLLGAPTDRLTIEVIIGENGQVGFHYADLDSDAERGAGATVGIENGSGSVAAQYSFNEVALTTNTSIVYTPAPPGTVSGTLSAVGTGTPVVGATVTLTPGGASTTTAADGGYQFTSVPVGEYTVSASTGDERCDGQYARRGLTHTGGTSDVDLSVMADGDEFGNLCVVGPQPFVAAQETVLDLSGDDATLQVATPFPVWLYGEQYTTGWVDTNGVVSFAVPDGSAWDASPIPSPAAPNRPNAAVYPMWDDWIVDEAASVRTAVLGAAPNRKWVLEWRNVRSFDDADARVSFEVVFAENGQITFGYADLAETDLEQGGGATVGIEDAAGAVALQYAYREPTLRPGQGVLFTPGDAGEGSMIGTVTCVGAAAAGAQVAVGGQTATTGPAGAYRVDDVASGAYALVVTVAAGGCAGSQTTPVIVVKDLDVVADVALAAPPIGGGYTVVAGGEEFTPADDDVVELTGDDDYTQISLAFPVALYGQTYTTGWVDTNGVVSFVAPDAAAHAVGPIPSAAAPNQPNAAVYPFWRDWIVDEQASVRTATLGTAPNRRFVIEWRNVVSWHDGTSRVTFEVTFEEGGDVVFGYAGIDPSAIDRGGLLATVGVENAAGDRALQYLHSHPGIRDGLSLRLHPPT